jgi:hypothetical protein
MVARKNQFLSASLLAVIILFLVFMHEVLNEIEHALPRPDLLLQIGGGKAIPGMRIACAVIVPTIEGDEVGGRAFEFGGVINQVGVKGKMGQTADRDPAGIGGWHVARFGW